MDEATFVVASREQLAAAVKTAAQPTHEAARANPFDITLGKTHYQFKAGVTERRAEALVSRILRTSAKAFDVNP